MSDKDFNVHILLHVPYTLYALDKKLKVILNNLSDRTFIKKIFDSFMPKSYGNF